jgi:hypothetical protein
MLCGNVEQGHVKGAFNTAVAVNGFVHGVNATGNVQRIPSLQHLGEILPHHKTGINAFAVDGHVRTAFTITSAAIGRADDHHQVLHVVNGTQRDHKGFFQGDKELIELNCLDSGCLHGWFFENAITVKIVSGQW